MAVNIATSAKTDEEGLELLKAFGVIFSEEGHRAKEEALRAVSKKESVLKRYDEMKKKQSAVEGEAKPEAKAEASDK